MQVFIPYADPFRTAAILDYRRLNKQVIECRQILKAIRGESKAWANHPVVKMYKDNTEWLEHYMHCMESYHAGALEEAKRHSELADACRPEWMTQELCDHHKKRLWKKDCLHYIRFTDHKDLYPGESEENWYIIDGRTVRYFNGKLINN